MNTQEKQRIRTLITALKRVLPKNTGFIIYDKSVISEDIMEDIIFALLEMKLHRDLERPTTVEEREP